MAQVAELVDALASGASNRKVVEVRVFSWAPFYLHFMCRKSLIHKHCVNHVAWSVEQIAQQKRGTICAMP